MSKEQKADVIAKSFVKHYYEKLQTRPKDLYLFYKEESSFSHGADANTAEVIVGLNNIRDKVNMLDYGNVVIDLTHGSVDAQSFEQTSVFITVSGSYSYKASAPRPFVQSFLLVLQGETKSYFVLNSVFRLLNSSLFDNNGSSSISVVTTQTSTKSSQTPAAESSNASTTTESAPVVEAVKVEQVVEKVVETTTHQAVPKSNEKKEEGGGRGNKRNKKENVEPKVEVTDSSAGGSPSFADLVRGWRAGDSTTPPAAPSAAHQPATVAAPAPVPEQQPAAPQPKKQGGSKKATEPTAPVEEKPKKEHAREKQQQAKVVETDNKGRGKPQMPTLTSLYVHNVPTSATVGELKALFSQFGKVLRVDAHQERGFAFVNFEHQDIVKAALNSEPVMCGGNILKIESRDRNNDGIGKIASPHANRSAKKDNEGHKKVPSPSEKSKEIQ